MRNKAIAILIVSVVLALAGSKIGAWVKGIETSSAGRGFAGCMYNVNN